MVVLTLIVHHIFVSGRVPEKEERMKGKKKNACKKKECKYYNNYFKNNCSASARAHRLDKCRNYEISIQEIG